MDSLTGKHLTHVAHVAPNCGWGRIPMRSGAPLSPPLKGSGEAWRNPLKRWGKRLCWFGGKKLRGGMGDMGGLFSVFTNYARVREKTLTAHP